MTWRVVNQLAVALGYVPSRQNKTLALNAHSGWPRPNEVLGSLTNYDAEFRAGGWQHAQNRCRGSVLFRHLGLLDPGTRGLPFSARRRGVHTPNQPPDARRLKYSSPSERNREDVGSLSKDGCKARYPGFPRGIAKKKGFNEKQLENPDFRVSRAICSLENCFGSQSGSQARLRLHRQQRFRRSATSSRLTIPVHFGH